MSAVGLNWPMVIRRLKERIDKLYTENQKMKRRLMKYEKQSRQMVNYYNTKEVDEDNNIGSTRDREDHYIINPS